MGSPIEKLDDVELQDFLNAMTRLMPRDTRFVVSKPLFNPRTGNWNVFLDADNVQDGDRPHATVCIELDDRKLRSLSGIDFLDYLTKEFSEANEKLVAFIDN